MPKDNDFDKMVREKFNPPQLVKSQPSLVDLQRRAVLRGIKAKLPKLPKI